MSEELEASRQRMANRRNTAPHRVLIKAIEHYVGLHRTQRP